MKKIPDRVTMDKSALDMDHVIPYDEMGELRCSDLDVPLCDPEYFTGVFIYYIAEFRNKHWLLLKQNLMDKHIIDVLFQMCDELVESFSNIVLKYVAPQVLARMKGQISLDDHSTSTETRNYHRVTAEDMEASLGDSFHFGFGAALDSKQERSHLSEQLTELFAIEVAEEVNCSLSLMGGPDSLREEGEPAPKSETYNSKIEMMVHLVAAILSELLNGSKNPGSQDTDSSEHSCLEEATSFEYDGEDEQASQDTDFTEHSDPEESTSFEYESEDEQESQDTDFTEHSCLEEATSLEDYDSEEDATEFFAYTVEEVLERAKTFLAVFLGNLVEHIAYSTKTSILDVDFERILARLIEKTAGELKPTLPQTVGNIHIPIFKKLCREFGSAKLLQSAMVSSDMAFEEAVAELLKAQLEKSGGETCSVVRKVRVFGKRTNKVTPACEVLEEAVPHCNVMDKENGSTPPPERKKKRPAIIRMLSSVARILRKPFTCCSSSGSLDD